MLEIGNPTMMLSRNDFCDFASVLLMWAYQSSVRIYDIRLGLCFRQEQVDKHVSGLSKQGLFAWFGHRNDSALSTIRVCHRLNE